MGRGGDQNDVAFGIVRKPGDKVVALMASAALGAVGAGVRFVHDDHLRAAPQELVAPPVGLDEVQGDDDEGVSVEDGLAEGAVSFEPGCGACEDGHGVDVELLLHLALPLAGQVRRAEDGQAGDLSAVEQLTRDEAGLDGFADADVVGDEQADGIELEAHEQRHELVRARRDGNAPERTERPGARPESEAHGVAQQAAGAVVAPVRRVGQGEFGGRDRLERGQDSREFVVGSAERAQHKKLAARLGQHHPLTITGADKGTDGEAHDLTPKMEGLLATMASQSSS